MLRTHHVTIREGTILYKRLEEGWISRDTIKLGTPVYLYVYQEDESFKQKWRKKNVHRSVNKLFYFNALTFVLLHKYHESYIVCIDKYSFIRDKTGHVSRQDFPFIRSILQTNISYKSLSLNTSYNFRTI